jgi:hypothetical protein
MKRQRPVLGLNCPAASRIPRQLPVSDPASEAEVRAQAESREVMPIGSSTRAPLAALRLAASFSAGLAAQAESPRIRLTRPRLPCPLTEQPQGPWNAAHPDRTAGLAATAQRSRTVRAVSKSGKPRSRQTEFKACLASLANLRALAKNSPLPGPARL